MFGDNPIRPPDSGNGEILDVQEIFATIQGEGPYCGMAAVFIRLGGCNLACDFCDTEFENFTLESVDNIVSDIAERAENDSKRTINLVVITGGEPFRQPIEKLCDELLARGFKVQIETNGTIYRPIDKRVDIVCSPKNTGKGYKPIRDDIAKRLLGIKFIISANDKSYGDIAEVGQSKYDIPVYVQPMDEHDKCKTQENIRLARKLAMEKNCILSLQLHKIMEIK